MKEVKVVGLRVDPLNLCNLPVINKIKSCPLFYFINKLCSVGTVCLYYGSSFAHKRVCTNYVQPIGCYFFLVVILWFQGPLHLNSSIYSWKISLFNDNVTTNYYYLWHPNSMWGVKNIVKKMKKDFECFCKLNKQHSWFVRALLCSLALSLSLNSFTGVLLSHIKLSNQIS